MEEILGKAIQREIPPSSKGQVCGREAGNYTETKFEQ